MSLKICLEAKSNISGVYLVYEKYYGGERDGKMSAGHKKMKLRHQGKEKEK